MGGVKAVYAARAKLAERVVDVSARRMPPALLDTAAAKTAAPRVTELMAAERHWDVARCEAERMWTEKRLEEGI